MTHSHLLNALRRLESIQMERVDHEPFGLKTILLAVTGDNKKREELGLESCLGVSCLTVVVVLPPTCSILGREAEKIRPQPPLCHANEISL